MVHFIPEKLNRMAKSTGAHISINSESYLKRLCAIRVTHSKSHT